MKKVLAILLTVTMILSLTACGGTDTGTGSAGNSTESDEEKVAQEDAAEDTQSGEDNGQESSAAEDGADATLKSFKMGYFDTGSQDGTSVPLRNNLVAAIESLGATPVAAQPAGNTPDDYLDALDTLISQGVDGIALPWVSFMFAGTPAAVKKCEDAGVYYGFYWGVDCETLGEDTLAICQDSPKFLGCFYQQENDAAYAAMSTLHDYGCDKLGYIGLAASNEMQENSRDYGVQKACEDFGMEILVEQRDQNVTMTAEGGATTVENFLTAYPEMEGIVIAGNTQFVMPGVAQAIASKGLTDFKVACIDFPDDMESYAKEGVLVYDAGAHITGPVYLTILVANAMNGTPLTDKGRSYNQQYIKLTSSEEIEQWVAIEDEIVYNTDELRQCLQIVNPDFDVDAFNELVLNYSYSDIMARHHAE
ncbi:sugar ABC transporter substrate-binding protein [Parablautia intestinalis]|jgi:ABC-type sugar transport system substrate-binding protein|uniref:sugar ABC transporter substrate-binding protein n=1 Tax=Parablautia intestinalis TaxID=2320100 RepID=UPI00256F5040|nr:substrate-binding domain-containing protein [Parablautia intestinalis]MCI8615866.1 substrate-binding domain-containing protein [Lachnospiraceae bacterium]